MATSIQQNIDAQLQEIRNNYKQETARYQATMTIVKTLQGFRVRDGIVDDYSRATKLAGTIMGVELLRDVNDSLEKTLGYWLRHSVENFFQPKIAVLRVDRDLRDKYFELHEKVTTFDQLAQTQPFNLKAVSAAYGETLKACNDLMAEQRERVKARQQKQVDQSKIKLDRQPVPAATTSLGSLPGAAVLHAMAKSEAKPAAEAVAA